MENPRSFIGPIRPYMGGAISGIGIGIILLAAFEQFTVYNLENFSRLILAIGLIAVAAGAVLARTVWQQAGSEK